MIVGIVVISLLQEENMNKQQLMIELEHYFDEQAEAIRSTRESLKAHDKYCRDLQCKLPERRKAIKKNLKRLKKHKGYISKEHLYELLR